MLRELYRTRIRRKYPPRCYAKKTDDFQYTVRTVSSGSAFALPLAPVVVLWHVVTFGEQPVNMCVHGRHPLAHLRVVLRLQEPRSLHAKNHPTATTSRAQRTSAD